MHPGRRGGDPRAPSGSRRRRPAQRRTRRAGPIPGRRLHPAAPASGGRARRPAGGRRSRSTRPPSLVAAAKASTVKGSSAAQARHRDRGWCRPPPTARRPSVRPRGAGAGRRPTGGPRAAPRARRSRGLPLAAHDPWSSTPAGFPVDPDVATTTATSAGTGSSGRDGSADHRPVGRRARAGQQRRSPGPCRPSLQPAQAGGPRGQQGQEGARGPCMGAAAPPWDGLRVRCSWRSQGRRQARVPHSRQRVRGVRVMVQGALWLAGQGVPGGAPGSGRGTRVVAGSPGRWSTCRGRPGGDAPSRAGPDSVEVGVPAAGPVVDVVGLAGFGGDPAAGDDAALVPGGQRPALGRGRGPGGAPDGQRDPGPEQGRGQGRDPQRRRGGPARRCPRRIGPPSAGAGTRRASGGRPGCGEELGDRVRAAPGVDHDRGDHRVAGGEPGLGLGQGVPAGGGPHLVPERRWCPG